MCFYFTENKLQSLLENVDIECVKDKNINFCFFSS